MSSSYPIELLTPHDDANHEFRLTKVGIHLLSLVSMVDKEDLSRTKIIRRHYPKYIPWYRATSGGGAITLGNRNWSHIYYTENWFSDNKELYGEVAYGNNLWVWLRMTAHEVIHIAHAGRFKFFIVYILVFVFQYARYGHDQAPLEQEADTGTRRLYAFNNFIVSKHNQSIIKILQGPGSEDEVIAIINEYWSQFNKRVY